MEKYTAVQVLDYFKGKIGIKKTRKRDYIDKRNYIISVLYYKFGYTEFELGDIFNVDRTSINYAKDQPYHLLKSEDAAFAENTKELAEKFPYIFPYHDRTCLPERVYSVVITLTKQDRDDLRIYANARSQYINSAARNIIQEKLKSIKK
jgi:hypothetical protein